MGVNVRERTDRPGSWVVTVTYKGIRRKLCCPDRPSAEDTAAIIREQLKNHRNGFEGEKWGFLPPLLKTVPFFDLREGQGADVCVYFIQLENNGPIKIGYTTNIGSRIRGYQTSNHKKVHLLTIVPGWGRKEEYALHELFRRQQVRNEWFLPSAELMFLIRSLHFIYHENTDVPEIEGSFQGAGAPRKIDQKAAISAILLSENPEEEEGET